MVTRTLTQRLLSPVGFLAVGCVFLLPFVTVSCSGSDGTAANGIRVVGSAVYSGKALVSGERAELTVSDAYLEAAKADPGPPIQAAKDRTMPIDRQPFMVVSLGLAVIGVLVTAWPRSWSRALSGAALAGLCALFLIGGEVIALRAAADRVNEDTAPYWGTPHPGIGHVGYGFWLALALLGVLIVVNVFDLARLSRAPTGPPVEAPQMA